MTNAEKVLEHQYRQSDLAVMIDVSGQPPDMPLEFAALALNLTE
ncbi:MAG: hypothetical protein ACU837_08200 [Gammaproteobacteria bacterium]